MIDLKGVETDAPNKVEIPILNFRGGVNRLLSESRIGFTEAKEALNLIQVEDGLWKTRWGTDYYGADFENTIDGAAEYVKSDGTRELMVIAGGKAWKSTDGGAKTEVTGATFTAGEQCYFLQIAGFLYIANGTDNLARYNGTTLTTYTAISAPTNLSASRAGLTSGSYSMYAEVTAVNEVGETVGSTEASVTLNKPRDLWIKDTDMIKWTWTATAGAAAYQIYISDTLGQECLVGNSVTTTYLDTGTDAINVYITPPLQNTTGAPKFKSMCMSTNRIYATNDPAAPYTVYFSGTGVNIGNFSDFYGGGWINLEKGGRETPTSVKHYQSGTGEGRATIFCKTPEGQGAVWQLSIAAATVGTETFSVPTAVKIVGSSGTDSILGTVATNNDILFPNKRGLYSLGPEKNYYGVLRTREISSKIRPYWRSLVGNSIGKVCGYFKDAKLFLSVPTSGTVNNRMIIYDLERLNWTVEWTIGAKQFLEYTGSDGNTKFLYVPYTGNKLIELSENIRGDLGVKFKTSYYSGRWSVAKLFKDFSKINKVYFKLNAPRGDIAFEILGSEKNKAFKTIIAKTLSLGSSDSNTGMGFDILGTVLMGSTNGIPSFFADSAVQKYMKVRKKLRDIQIRISTDNVDADYTLLGFIIEGNTLKINPPTGEKL